MARSSTTYPRKWKSTGTTVIRVPARFSGELIDIARRMDNASAFSVREDRASYVLEFTEPKARHTHATDTPTNVASIPQRSPFRYPGGKTWLVPFIRDWLRSKPKPPVRLIEPFAGGAIVSLTAAFEGLAQHVIFAELDRDVAAVWKIILNGQAEWLSKEILKFDLNLANVRAVLGRRADGLRDRAFQTIIRNRVQRGGIMADGAGLVKTGENGRGLGSRWYPETLARRIREINEQKRKLTFFEDDAFSLIDEHKMDRDAAFYIDPPYTMAARRLYPNWRVDHGRLFSAMRSCKGDFLMSYDNTSEIVALAHIHGFATHPIAMKNTHHARMTELLIGKDLSWLKKTT